MAGANGPWLYHFGKARYHEYEINKPAYKARNGHRDDDVVPDSLVQDLPVPGSLTAGLVS